MHYLAEQCHFVPHSRPASAQQQCSAAVRGDGQTASPALAYSAGLGLQTPTASPSQRRHGRPSTAPHPSHSSQGPAFKRGSSTATAGRCQRPGSAYLNRCSSSGTVPLVPDGHQPAATQAGAVYTTHIARSDAAAAHNSNSAGLDWQAAILTLQSVLATVQHGGLRALSARAPDGSTSGAASTLGLVMTGASAYAGDHGLSHHRQERSAFGRAPRPPSAHALSRPSTARPLGGGASCMEKGERLRSVLVAASNGGARGGFARGSTPDEVIDLQRCSSAGSSSDNLPLQFALLVNRLVGQCVACAERSQSHRGPGDDKGPSQDGDSCSSFTGGKLGDSAGLMDPHSIAQAIADKVLQLGATAAVSAEAAAHAQAQAAALREDNTLLRNTLAARVPAAQPAQEALSEVQRQLANARADLAVAQAALAHCTTEATNSDRLLTQAHVAHAALQTRAQGLQAQLSNTQQQADVDKKQAGKLLGQVHAAETAHAQAGEQLQAALERVQELQEATVTQAQRMCTRSTETECTGQDVERAWACQIDLRAARKRKSELSSQLQASRQQEQRLSAEVQLEHSKQQEAQAALEAARREAQQAVAAHAAASANAAELRTALQVQEQDMCRQAADRNLALSDMESALRAAQQAAHNAAQQAASAEAQQEVAQAELQESQAQVCAMRSGIDAADSKVLRLQAALGQAERNRDAAKNQLEATKAHTAQLDQARRVAEDSQHASHKQAEEACSKLDAMSCQLATLQSECVEWQRQHEALVKDVDSAMVKLVDSERKGGAAAADVAQLERLVAELGISNPSDEGAWAHSELQELRCASDRSKIQCSPVQSSVLGTC
jgi:hypothetical protein